MYWQQFLLVAGIHALAVMSPGPDFAMIAKNSLTRSRKAGVYAAVGLGLGILVHVAYSLLGIALVISNSILLFNIIKTLGAAYLIYIGLRALFTKKAKEVDDSAIEGQPDMSPAAAVRQGFLTNVLNPKATLFFLALFTQIIEPGTPVGIKAMYGIEMSLATIAWFSFVALVLSAPQIKRRFEKIQHRFEQVFGAILVAFGVRIMMEGQK